MRRLALQASSYALIELPELQRNVDLCKLADMLSKRCPNSTVLSGPASQQLCLHNLASTSIQAQEALQASSCALKIKLLGL